MSKSKLMKKRRHHHVWQHYLKPWVIDGKITCLTGGKLVRTSTINVAVEKDFYAIQKLTALDVRVLEGLIEQGGHPIARDSHRRLLRDLNHFPALVEGQDKEIDAIVETFRANILEDLHAQTERVFIPLLSRALAGDVSFYFDDKECIGFLNYLSSQYMRTKGIQSRVNGPEYKTPGIDLSRIWPIWN